MKTLTVHINDDKQAALLETLLNSMNFVESVESNDEEEVSEEVINMLNERMEEYKRNPERAVDAKEFGNEIRKKYGL